MRRNNKLSEEEVQRRVKDLPEVRDQRPKDEIYYNIMEKRQSQKATGSSLKRWAVPVLSAAALLLMIILVPAFFPSSNQSSSPEENNQDNNNESRSENESNSEDIEEEPPGEDETMHTQESESEEDETVEPEEKEEETEDSSSEDEESQEQEAEEETVQEPEVTVGGNDMPEYDNYTAALQEDIESDGMRPVTIPLQDGTSSVIVPVTILASESDESLLESFDQLNDEFSPEGTGLEESALQNIEWTKEEEEVPSADFEEENTEGSAESDLIVRSLEEIARYLDEDEVKLSYNGEPGLDLANFGNVESLDITTENRGYYVYTTEEDVNFLVTGNGASLPTTREDGQLLTIEETFEQMQNHEEQNGVAASIPSDMNIVDVEEEEETATIVFEEGTTFPEDDNGTLVTEAILFAASDFGFESINFEGTESTEAGEYNLEETISVPAGPNFMEDD
ncbi:hypothetical protein [Alteribacillus sp. HJP-4]|uniref:hypothetical protein n=1 Tax=Alteribacillus sp. HJP-4 TaxID=2775394 RepID=UPI0035CD32C9